MINIFLNIILLEKLIKKLRDKFESDNPFAALKELNIK